MASVYDLKPSFQKLLRLGAQALARRGTTANQVTIAAFLPSLAPGAALALNPSGALWAVPATLLLRMALNAVDGMLGVRARHENAAGRNAQ